MFIYKFIFILLLSYYSFCLYNVQNIHLSLHENGISISWKTHLKSDSIVNYGINKYNLDNIQYGYSTSYSIKSGYNHNVILSLLNLESTTYYYTCGDNINYISDIYNFTTKPEQFTKLSIAVYGDMGIDNSNNTISQLITNTQNNNFDLFIHTGDISYANDHSQEYEKTWDKWFTSMQSIMTKLPYMVTPGNHESVCKAEDCFYQTTNFTTFKQKFLMPGNSSGTNTNMFYSFNYGKIHFISISTESDYPGAPPLESDFPGNYDNTTNQEYYFQVNWLHEDLQKAVANRHNIPWIIIFGHRPIYAPLLEKNNIPTGYSLRLQSFLEPILKEYSVDLFLNGHVHAYARTYPIYNNTITSTNYINPTSTVHICAGGAGNAEGISTFPQPLPIWYAGGNDINYGYGQIVMENESSLTWNYYISTTGELVDTFTIIKDV